jgi:hypothetical protein
MAAPYPTARLIIHGQVNKPRFMRGFFIPGFFRSRWKTPHCRRYLAKLLFKLARLNDCALFVRCANVIDLQLCMSDDSYAVG